MFVATLGSSVEFASRSSKPLFPWQPAGAKESVKTVLLMRHANAESELPGQGDFDRVLTDDGREVALRTGCLLAELGLKPDRVIASAAVRTCETAELVVSSVRTSSGIVLMHELYNAPAFSVTSVLRGQMFDDESCLLMVGHNPGIASVMCRWSGQSLSVPPATLTIFRSSDEGWNSAGSETCFGMALAGIIQGGQLVWKEPSADFGQTTDG